MRNAVSRIACWNRRAADRASATHRNEREVRSNLLIEIGHVLGYSHGRFLKSIVAAEWPDTTQPVAKPADVARGIPVNLAFLPPGRRRGSVSRASGSECFVISIAEAAALRTLRINQCPSQDASQAPAGCN